MAAFAAHLHHRRHIAAILNAIAQVDLPQLGLQPDGQFLRAWRRARQIYGVTLGGQAGPVT
jgi:hypothetical protein